MSLNLYLLSFQCGDIVPGAEKGIQRAAERMIAHAHQSMSAHTTSLAMDTQTTARF